MLLHRDIVPKSEFILSGSYCSGVLNYKILFPKSLKQ